MIKDQIIANLEKQLSRYSDEIRINEMEAENAVAIERLQTELSALKSQIPDKGIKESEEPEGAEVRSAEEILDKHTERNRAMKVPEGIITTDKRLIYAAMEEYRSQAVVMPSDAEKETKDTERLKELRKIIEINKSGYAGVMQNGNIVDRREHPEAIPVQKNTLLGIPEPKELT